MGLSLNSTKWGCWKGHGGSSPTKLIQALLRCSWSEAKALAGQSNYGDSELDAMRRKLAGPLTSVDTSRGLEPFAMPEEVFALDSGKRSEPFLAYLKRRGIDLATAKRFRLHGSYAGEYRYRVVVPFYAEGTLVGASGRHIGTNTLRYYTQPAGVTNRVLFNEDGARDMRGDVLCLVEGPFDTMRLDSIFEEEDLPCSAVGLLGLILTPAKRSVLVAIARRYRTLAIMTDRKAEAQALRFLEQVGSCTRSRVVIMPDDVKDPGEMTRRQVLLTVARASI
jgi:hypothetical protein